MGPVAREGRNASLFIRFSPNPVRLRMMCPVCNCDLAMGERLTFSIDYCPQCRGIWLEKGKLDQIIERSASSAPPAMQRSVPPGQGYPPPYGRHDDHHDDDHDKKKRKKGFLEEIFD